jgi:amino-acid N-acetyltransferase
MAGPAALRPARAGDREAIDALLGRLALPTTGVHDWLDRFWVAEHAGAIIGVAGVELYGDAALLRSVAVEPAWRGTGLGRALVERALDAARAAGAREAFLLTTTAEEYFPRIGFERIAREAVPEGVQASVEFRGACPASAAVMRTALV